MVRLKINATLRIKTDKDNEECLISYGNSAAKMLRQLADELEDRRRISCAYPLDSFTMMDVDTGWKGTMSYSVE